MGEGYAVARVSARFCRSVGWFTIHLTMSAKLQTVVDALGEIAPLNYAEEWDNVGLLIEPTRPKPVQRLLLTIDLTDAVFDEALLLKAQCIVAYHPPIFKPIARVAGRIAQLLEQGIAVYSPHTALDAAPGGVNDWLASGLGRGRIEPIQPGAHPDDNTHKVVVFTPVDHVDTMRAALSEAGAGIIGAYTQCAWGTEGTGSFLGDDTTHPAIGKKNQLEHIQEVRLETVCPESALPHVARAISEHHPYEEPAWDVYALHPKPGPGIGQGRLLHLSKWTTLATIVRRAKKHLGLKQVRLAAAPQHENFDTLIGSIALCAGAGGSVLAGQSAAVYLTGEMRHHDILAANRRGASVILTDHTNTERPYLPVLADRLTDMLNGKVDIRISRCDADPLRIV